MIFLPTVNDVLQVITSATPGGSGVNCHVSYTDLASGVVTAGRTNTRVTTAATSTILAAPASSTVRNIKSIKISNDGTAAQTLTLQLYDGTNTIILESLALAAGERLGYEEGTGFRVFDSLGREKAQTALVPTDQNNVTADQTITGVDAYVLGSDYALTGRLKIGSVIRWTVTFSKTDSVGTATPIFNIRVGTAGAIGDTVRCTMTGRAQTAVVDTARIEISAHFRVVGASTVIQAVMGGDHNLATTGMSTGGFANQVASSAFDVTPANTKAGISVNPGASSVWVVRTCAIEGLNLLA